MGTVVNGNVAHLVPMTIGQDDGATVEVVAGLNADDRVIQDPPDSIIEGEKLTVESPDGRTGSRPANPQPRNEIASHASRSEVSEGNYRRDLSKLGMQGVATPASCLRMAQRKARRLSAGWPCARSAFRRLQAGRARTTIAPASPRPPPTKRPARPPSLPPPNPAGGSWQTANPSDGMLRGKWWEIYHDPELNQLEERIATNNQQLKQAMENYLAARDQIAVVRANLFPTLSVVAQRYA